jgi:hypothetical protein
MAIGEGNGRTALVAEGREINPSILRGADEGWVIN